MGSERTPEEIAADMENIHADILREYGSLEKFRAAIAAERERWQSPPSEAVVEAVARSVYNLVNPYGVRWYYFAVAEKTKWIDIARAAIAEFQRQVGVAE